MGVKTLNLYHFTKPEYLRSVLTSGLIPGHKSGMTRMSDQWSCVFLTDDPNYIVEHQCGKDWSRVLLKINCAGLDIVPHVWKGWTSPAPHEFIYFGTIIPQRITKCVSTY